MYRFHHIGVWLVVLRILPISAKITQSTNAIRAFCSQLSGPTAFTGTGWGSRAGASVRVLSNLFYGLEQHWSSRSQYYVYDALVDVCQRASLIHELPTDLVQLNVRMCSF
jgi:hypothetical protein